MQFSTVNKIFFSKKISVYRGKMLFCVLQCVFFRTKKGAKMGIASTSEIIDDLKNGKMVILVDEEDRENEGDLLIAAEFVTPEVINFMAHHARGLVCLTLTESHCRRLGLTQMTRNNQAQYSTAFTVSIEAAEGVTTGISAADRAHTIRVAAAPDAIADDVVQPGHIFPVTACEGGVLVRAGHTEAGCDLTRLAGLTPAATICEIMNEDGTMARLPELLAFGEKHGIKIGTIANLIHYRATRESLVARVSQKTIATAFGEFELIAYADKTSGKTHLVMQYGNIPEDEETLVRVHEPLSVLDFLDPQSHPGAFSLADAQKALVKNGHGIIVLMQREEKSQDWIDRLNGQIKQIHKWDPRTYGIGAQILRDLGVKKMRLLSRPQKMPSMAGFGLEVTGFITQLSEVPEAKVISLPKNRAAN